MATIPSHPMAPAILLLGSSKKTIGITEDLAEVRKNHGDFKRWDEKKVNQVVLDGLEGFVLMI
jgi:hypothetical protein